MLSRKDQLRVLANCFLLINVVIFYSSCKQRIEEPWRHIEVCPIDKTQIITVITKGDKRYFMNGKHDDVPNDGYLLLDISQVDPLGDGVSVCWHDSGHKWKIASSYALLIENKLDTSKFLYYQPKGKNGEPISEGYLGDNCGGILIRENSKPRGNVIVKYIAK